jgi:hypothetical protein
MAKSKKIAMVAPRPEIPTIEYALFLVGNDRSYTILSTKEFSNGAWSAQIHFEGDLKPKTLAWDGKKAVLK